MARDDQLSEEVLRRLAEASEQADPGPWAAMVEGRDHLGGDSFILVGEENDRRTDIYVTRDREPAGAAELDVIALGRSYLPLLVDEVLRLRRLLQERG